MRNSPSGRRPLAKGLVILHEDRDLLVVDKPSGLLTIGEASDRALTAYSILTHYVRKGAERSRNRVFVVHRLDRDTSGILLFAKNEKTKNRLQETWPDTEKRYLAVVHGTCEKQEETISTYLAENRAQVVYSTSDPTQGKLSHTAYRVLRQTKHFALLEVELLTGRKNQIRVHLSERGHPIVGDKKYGKANDTHARLALHAQSIVFSHPTTGKRLSLTAKMPSYFEQLVGKVEIKEIKENEEDRSS